jgi:anti-sigma-K factor RskA
MQNKYWRFIVNILAIVAVLLIIGEISDRIRNEKPLDYNPRHAVNGIDTVYTRDSIYTIKVEIKNVEPEPPDEPRDYN